MSGGEWGPISWIMGFEWRWWFIIIKKVTMLVAWSCWWRINYVSDNSTRYDLYNIPFIVGWRCVELIFDCDFVLESEESNSIGLSEDMMGEDRPSFIIVSWSEMNSAIYLTSEIHMRTYQVKVMPQSQIKNQALEMMDLVLVFEVNCLPSQKRLSR